MWANGREEKAKAVPCLGCTSLRPPPHSPGGGAGEGGGGRVYATVPVCGSALYGALRRDRRELPGVKAATQKHK